MEFHLLNEREIKTIRPRTSARSCLQARSRARVRPPRHSLIFTLGILDPETTFDSSVGFNFFRAALFIPPIPHLSLSPRRSFIAASFTVRLPLTILAAPSSLSPSERERESEKESHPSSLSLFLTPRARLFAPYPFASSPFCALHRSCAHALPCFSRHFSLSRRAGSVHLVLATVSFPSSSSSAKYRWFPNRRRSYRATHPNRYRSRTDSSLQPFVHAISHPVRNRFA